MRPRHYVLDENADARAVEFMSREHLRFMSATEADPGLRRVAVTRRGDARVSTVFLSLDHSFTEGLPILWETMVFGGTHDQDQERYASRVEAQRGHLRVCRRVWGKDQPPTAWGPASRPELR